MSAKRLGEEGGHASLLVSERSLQLNMGCVNRVKRNYLVLMGWGPGKGKKPRANAHQCKNTNSWKSELNWAQRPRNEWVVWWAIKHQSRVWEGAKKQPALDRVTFHQHRAVRGSGRTGSHKHADFSLQHVVRILVLRSTNLTPAACFMLSFTYNIYWPSTSSQLSNPYSGGWSAGSAAIHSAQFGFMKSQVVCAWRKILGKVTKGRFHLQLLWELA